ncbi:MAG: hypothetical protein V4733_10035 [Verrucomicrobiota bacterium]
MKAYSLISGIALMLSLGAIFIAIKATENASEAKINALIDARLAARELRLVQTVAPKFREMFVATGDPDFDKNWNPRTLEELAAPILKMTSE